MTETLKTMLSGAKSVDEAFDILCAHGDGISSEDQMKMFKMVTGKTELTEDELEMVVGGSWFSSAWKSVKAVANAATNATERWCYEHKTELVIAACVIAGVCLGGMAGAAIVPMVGVAGGVTTGSILGGAATVATFGAMIGAAAGARIMGVEYEDTNIDDVPDIG